MAANKQASMLAMCVHVVWAKVFELRELDDFLKPACQDFSFKLGMYLFGSPIFWQTKCHVHLPHTIHTDFLWKYHIDLEASCQPVCLCSLRLSSLKNNFGCCIFSTTQRADNNSQTSSSRKPKLSFLPARCYLFINSFAFLMSYEEYVCHFGR